MNRSSNQTKELIGRAIDEGGPLPDWLASRIENDSSLKEFRDASVELSTELRRSADSWINLNRRSNVTCLRSRESMKGFRDRFPLAAFASTALVLLAFVGFAWLASRKSWNQSELAAVEDRAEFAEPSTQESAVARASVASREVPSTSSAHSSLNSNDQFEKYFFVTVESSFRTFQSVGEVLSNNAVNEPLERTIQANGDQDGLPEDRKSDPATSSAELGQNSLHQKQIQLIRELMETTDFLVETLPKEVTQSWMDLSVATNSSH